QNMVRGAAARPGTAQYQRQLFAHPRLADETVQRGGPQSRFDIAVRGQVAGADRRILRPRGVVVIHDRLKVLAVQMLRYRREARRTHASIPSAARSAVELSASGCSARTASIAGSACFAGKPRPISASTT